MQPAFKAVLVVAVAKVSSEVARKSDAGETMNPVGARRDDLRSRVGT